MRIPHLWLTFIGRSERTLKRIQDLPTLACLRCLYLQTACLHGLAYCVIFSLLAIIGWLIFLSSVYWPSLAGLLCYLQAACLEWLAYCVTFRLLAFIGWLIVLPSSCLPLLAGLLFYLQAACLHWLASSTFYNPHL